MIDRERRKQLGELIRHLLSRQITNCEFEDAWDVSRLQRDAGVLEAAYFAWTLYSDLREHRVEFYRLLNREERRQVLRLLLFLQTNLEYEWPRQHVWYPLTWLGFLVTIGLSVVAEVPLWLRGVGLCIGLLTCLCTWPRTVLYRWMDSMARLLKLHRDLSPFSERIDLWPFSRREDYEEALRHPRLLCGADANHGSI